MNSLSEKMKYFLTGSIIMTVFALNAEPVEFTFDLGTQRVIEEGDFSKSELDRDRYFRSYHSLGQFSDARHHELESIGAVPGRGTYRFYVQPESDDFSKFTESSIQKTIEQRETTYRKAKERAPHLDHILAHGKFPNWMRKGAENNPDAEDLEDWERQSEGNILRPDLYEPVADVIVRWYDRFKEKDVHYPIYYTVQNEPITAWDPVEFSKYTRIVAERMEAAHPDVLVAGPCSAWPYPSADWSVWNSWQKIFIDLAGDSVDAYDLHFYSKGHWALPDTDYWRTQKKDSPSLYINQKQGNTTVWDYGRLDAYFDLWNAYHLRVWGGKTKPMIVSEFGRQTIHPQFGPWINDFWPWLYMNTVTRMWMTYMDRPEIRLTIPFILPEADRGYVPKRGQAIYTRLNEENLDELTVTRFRDFYDFFSDLEGTRIPFEVKALTVEEKERLFALALRKDNEVYLLLHNGGGYPDYPMTLNVKGILDGENIDAESISVKRLYYTGPVPESDTNEEEAPGKLVIAKPDEYEPVDSNTIELKGEETVVVKFRYKNDLKEMDARQIERRYYSKDTLVNFIAGRIADGVIELPSPLPENVSKAVLRIGLARNGGFDQNPRVAFNGEAFPEIDASHSRGVAEYHAVSTQEIPAKFLNEGSNQVRVAFPEPIRGGSPVMVSLRLDLYLEK